MLYVENEYLKTSAALVKTPCSNSGARYLGSPSIGSFKSDWK